VLDILTRLIKTKKGIYSKVKVFNFSEEYNTSYIIIYITLLKPIIIKPGCYFFICSDKISKLEWHPLSLIYEKNNNLVFCVKNTTKKSWSDNLKNLENTKYIFNNTDNIYLQGPYYHLNLKYNYEYIINIANGIGVTPFFTILKHINKIINQKNSVIKKVVFVWIIPDIEFLKPFIEYFNDLKNIDIQIFLTKKNATEFELVKFGRIFFNKPIINDYIKNFIEVNHIKDTKHISIISCGSKNLLNDIHSATSYYGIDLYNESFI
jgi:predicted ferric reductase